MVGRTTPVHAVVIGGSAGALDVLRLLLRELPPSLPVPVIVVLHLSARPPDQLAQLLGRECALTVKQAEDKEPLQPGVVYVAPPGYHLLVESHHALALSIDPPVNFSRPSIAVLFESALDAFGKHLLAVLLSGASSDGAASLQEIHASGGLTVVQDPESAEAATMPAAAVSLFQPAHVWTASEMARQLPGLLDEVAAMARSRSAS